MSASRGTLLRTLSHGVERIVSGAERTRTADPCLQSKSGAYSVPGLSCPLLRDQAFRLSMVGGVLHSLAASHGTDTGRHGLTRNGTDGSHSSTSPLSDVRDHPDGEDYE